MRKLLLTTLLAGCISNTFAAGNPEYVKFVLKNAHERNFTGCDKGISDVFGLASGDDIRVVTTYFEETKNDSLKITAAYGKPGDSVLTEAQFRKLGPNCYATKTTVLTSENSCTAYLAEMPAFKYSSEAPGHVWTKNQGGVNMILRPLGNSCVVIFQNSMKY